MGKKAEKQVKETNQKKSFHMPKVEMPKMPDISKVDIKTKFTSLNENIEKPNDKSKEKDTCPKDVPNDKDASVAKVCIGEEGLPELPESKQEHMPNDEDAAAAPEIACMVEDDLPDGDVVSYHEQPTVEDGHFEQCEDQFDSFFDQRPKEEQKIIKQRS